MCGVLIAFKLNKKVSEAALLDALNTAAHRGPDHSGHYTDGFCFLGHTRLSIVGIEESGNQPYFFEDLAMVYNGEIFNFIELHEELEALGYTFETRSDTEVVLKAFHCWGSKCFEKFNGMWALAIYNQKTQQLVASRDRFGQKPLFIMKQDDTIYLASEFQQLVPFSDRKINFHEIQAFLKEGSHEIDGSTFYESIELFPKAYFCEIDRDLNIHSESYWSYYTGKIQKTDENSLKEFEDLLKDAVKIRLRTDVPYSVLLSGGVDSTLIAAYTREFAKNLPDIPAFTFASHVPSEDESHYAQVVADELNMSLTKQYQDDNPDDYILRLKALVRHLGRGHSSPAIVSIDYLYESVAQKGIKVALDGQGADELLAGYKHYFHVLAWSLFWRGKWGQLKYLLKDWFQYGVVRTTLWALRILLPAWGKKLGRYIYGYESLFKSFKKRKTKFLVKLKPKHQKNKNALNRFLIWQHNEGLENLLYYGDITAMRHSVENRSPFIDHRLVDYSFSHSERLKVWFAKDKNVLRSTPVYERFKGVLEREKMGFLSPIKKSSKQKMIADLQQSPILEWPIFSLNLQTFLNGTTVSKGKFERFLFRLYQVHLWNELFNSKQ